MLSALEAVAAEAGLSPLDLRFAALMGRLVTREQAPLIELTAALLSRERSRGHPCIELAAWATQSLVENGDHGPRMPDLADWTQRLRATAVVGSGEPATPLVLDAAARLYLHRYWDAERRVGARIRALVAAAAAVDASKIATMFRRLFPAPAKGDEDAERQAWVATAVLRNRFTVVSGGPGTGKTTTIARLLALLLASDDTMSIAVAAPTGKAAARLTESIRAQLDEIAVSETLRERLAGIEARTIHRLLGYAPRSGGFRHDAESPLPCDIVIIDEASMVDLLLVDAVLEAIPPHGRVVLVGDKDQLASVEAGFVFGDCCEAAAHSGYSLAFAEDFRRLCGREFDTAGGAQSVAPLRDSGVELRLAWRFREHPGIGKLADAVRRSDAVDALAALSDSALSDVERFDLPEKPEDVVLRSAATFEAVRRATSPEQALVALNRSRILCATNRGIWGVEHVNDLVERTLETRALGEWYRGRPLLVSQNDYALGLFNGDVGICFPDEQGRLRAWFAGRSGVRAFAPNKLPPHETAWAMTVHKSQGSEFEHATFVLPDGESALLSRELVYTAVTRARQQVSLFANVPALRAAIERRAGRTSGLRDLLLAEPRTA